MRRFGRIVFGMLLLFGSTPAWGVNLDFSGEARTRGFYTDNLTDQSDAVQDSEAYTNQRFRLKAKAVDRGVTAVATLDLLSKNGSGHARWGDAQYNATQDPDIGNAGVGVLEAYVKGDLAAGLAFSIGREGLKLGKSLILDDPVDGARFFFNLNLGAAAVTVGDAKVADNTNGGGNQVSDTPGAASSGAGDDTDFYFANAAFGVSAFRGELFAGYLNDRGQNTVAALAAQGNLSGTVTFTDRVGLTVAGITLDGKMGPLAVTGEIDALQGKAENLGGGGRDLSGKNLLLGASLDMKPAMVGLTLLYGSGQETGAGADINVNGLSGNYPLGIILTNVGAKSYNKDGTCPSVNGQSFGGIPNCIGGNGIQAAKLAANLRARDRLTIDAGAIYAKAAEGTATGNTIGVELDGTARYEVSEHLSILGGVGYLMPDDFYGASPDNVTVFVSEVKYIF